MQQEEAHDLDDVARLYMLLVPRPPSLKLQTEIVPEPATEDEKEKHFRLLIVAKKKLPDPDAPTGKGKKKEVCI